MAQRLSHQQIEGFCRSIALLLRAGIGLGDGLLLLADQEEGARRALLSQMGERADQGTPPSQTMEEAGGFPAYVTGMIRVGEETGRLEESLEALADYYAERMDQDRQIRGVVVYPAVLLLVMLFGITKPALAEFTVFALAVQLLMLPIVGFQIVGSNYFQATGQPIKSTVLTLTRQVIFLVPMYMVLPELMPVLLPQYTWLDAVYFACPVADFLAIFTTAVFMALELRRLKRIERGELEVKI